MTRALRGLLLFACIAVLAGPPAQAADGHRPDRATLPDVPRRELPPQAVAHAMAQADHPTRPRRFAVGVASGASLADGRWDSSARSGIARWRLRLRSPGARSVSAHLAPLALPPAAQLWIYGAKDGPVFGPFGAAQAADRSLWTPLVAGDELVLEVQAPAAAADEVQLTVAKAFHGYEDWDKASGPGTSGSCNVDADCEAAAWGDEARSVAMITIGNVWVCSGQLLNNVRQDQAPLFLTARHCGIEHDKGPADSVNFYFNYGGPCGLPAPLQPETTVTGSRLLAEDVQSDFALLRINGVPPPNAYFAGWNATGQGSSSGASLHHPNGDAKKISLYETPIAEATVSIGLPSCTVEAWEVRWARGTTEGGSSGGGLWNASHQVIGVLSGGTASCENPGGADYYGRLGLAWTAGEAPENQLKAHLDPDGSCIAAIPGLDPADNPTPEPISSGPTLCEGERSTCTAPGGGGSMSLALLGLLLARLRRRAPRR